MMVVQDAYYIPDDIATKLAIGEYKRVGSIIRHAVGPNKGQIVKHLKPIKVKKNENNSSIIEKSFKFLNDHKKEAVLGTGLLVVGAGVYIGYNKIKSKEPKELLEFRKCLNVYIKAIREGNMSDNLIDDLIKSFNTLKNHKDYEKIKIQLSADDFDKVVNNIYGYTIQLTVNNGAEITENYYDENNGFISKFEFCLNQQKQVFNIVN